MVGTIRERHRGHPILFKNIKKIESGLREWKSTNGGNYVKPINLEPKMMASENVTPKDPFLQR
jgi:hypothetical protein